MPLYTAIHVSICLFHGTRRTEIIVRISAGKQTITSIEYLLLILISITTIFVSHTQARLESEIENLSWKFERAETTDRADLENQMDIAEKLRVTLLKDFFNACTT